MKQNFLATLNGYEIILSGEQGTIIATGDFTHISVSNLDHLEQ